MNYLMFSVVRIGGEGMINQLLTFLLIALCVGVVYAMGWFFFKRQPPFPPVVLLIWQGLFVLVGGIVIINFLLGLGGYSFLKW